MSSLNSFAEHDCLPPSPPQLWHVADADHHKPIMSCDCNHYSIIIMITSQQSCDGASAETLQHVPIQTTATRPSLSANRHMRLPSTLAYCKMKNRFFSSQVKDHGLFVLVVISLTDRHPMRVSVPFIHKAPWFILPVQCLPAAWGS